jgi:hypothetical protein
MIVALHRRSAQPTRRTWRECGTRQDLIICAMRSHVSHRGHTFGQQISVHRDEGGRNAMYLVRSGTTPVRLNSVTAMFVAAA